MELKKLWPLAAILAVLLLLVVVKQTSQPGPVRVTQDRFAALAPEDLDTGAIARIELYSGAEPDSRLVLARAAGTDAWKVESHHGAPALQTKIDEFLGAVARLRGEFRAAPDSDGALDIYELDEGTAFHVAGYASGGEEPAFHLLVGKAPAFEQVFVRRAGDRTVYVADTNLRQEAGLFGDDLAQAPPANPWLDKEIIQLAQADIRRLELTTPDKHLAFERREAPAPEEPPGPGTGEAGDEPAPDLDLGEPETEWVLVSGGLPGAAFKQTGLDNILRSFENLQAQDVVDPAQREEYGLDAPPFRVALSVEGRDAPVVIEGARPDPSGDGYVQVADGPDGLVYTVSGFNFGRIFARGADLFDLPAFAVEADELRRIEVQQPEGGFVLVKRNDDWTVESPQADLNLQESTIDSLVRAAARIRATDYADGPDGPGLTPPLRELLLTLASGETRYIHAGELAPGVDGYYAHFDDPNQTLIMARSDYDRLFVKPQNLYELRLFDFTAADIASVTVLSGDAGYTLNRADDGWTVEAEGDVAAADGEAADDLCFAIARLRPESADFAAPGLNSATAGIVRARLESGEEVVLTLGEAREDGTHELAVQGKRGVFILSAFDGQSLLTPLDDFLPEPEPEHEATDEPAPEAVEAPDEAVDTAPEADIELDAAGAAGLESADAGTDQAAEGESLPLAVDTPIVDGD